MKIPRLSRTKSKTKTDLNSNPGPSGAGPESILSSNKTVLGGPSAGQPQVYSNSTEDLDCVEEPTRWRKVASSGAKVLVEAIGASADVFPPLKSVAAGLAYLIRHHDVS